MKFCRKPKSKKEILDHVGYKNRTYLTRKFLKPMIESGKLAYTIPEKPTSRLQKYIPVSYDCRDGKGIQSGFISISKFPV